MRCSIFEERRFLSEAKGLASSPPVYCEWFTLSSDEISNFKKICEEAQKTIDSIMDNPFYNKDAKV